MASNKLYRTNEDIKYVLSELLREIKDPRISDQGLISVTSVDTTGDLRYSKIYISVLGLKNEKELKKGLKSASGYLRRELGRSLQLRYTPELQWVADDSITHGAHILDILSKLDIREDDDDAAADHDS